MSCEPVRRRHRSILVVLWAAVGLILLAGPADAAEPLTLSTSVDRPTFTAGEPVTLTATVTNRTGSTCALSTTSEGALRVVSVTRDGNPVSPYFGTASYLDGYTSYLRNNLTDVPAGKSVTLTMGTAPATDGIQLTATQPMPSGGGLVTGWSLEEPGAYRISLMYQVPRVPKTDEQPCAGASGVSVADFTVTAARPTVTDLARRWGPIAAAVAGGIALLVLVLLLRRRNRRGRRGRAMAASLILLGTLGTAVVQARPAAANIGVASNVTGLSDAVSGCLDTITKVGGPSAAIVKYFDSPDRQIYVSWEYLKRDGQDIYDVHNHATVRGSHTFANIWWNSMNGPGLKFKDGVAYDSCAALLHELAHIKLLSEGQHYEHVCSAAFRIPIYEVRVMEAENAYRKAVGLAPRGKHNDDPMPPGGSGACDDQPGKGTGEPSKSGCSGLNATCGRTRGDPHLTTFDNLGYDFQAAGEFVAARSTDGALEVQTRQTPAFGSRTVTLNSAVAVKAGRNRITLTFTDGQLMVRLNGRPVTADTPLSGGGRLTKRAGWSPYAANGWSVTWPDRSTMDVDPFGDSWLDVSIAPAPTLARRLTGLLGNFDGNADNDLTPRTGRPLPRDADFDALYRTFGDSWRVDAQNSLFDYQDGASPATFADRSIPDHRVTAAGLPPEARKQATQVCTRQGVTEAALLEACVIDVAHTGQAGFVVSSAVAQQQSTPATSSGEIHDGSTVTGRVDTAGGTRRYELDLGSATDFSIADWRGPNGGCDQAFSVNLVGLSSNNLPCSGGAIRFHVPDPAAHHQLEIAAVPGRQGDYAFSLVTVKIRRTQLTIGEKADYKISTRGEEHHLEFDPGPLRAIRLTELPPCPNAVLGDLYDVTAARTVTGRALCGSDSTITLPDPGHRYAVIARSEDLTTGQFHFTLNPG